MVPTPRERLKKDCPRAAAMAAPLSLLKSGRTRYATPSFEPGRVRETLAITIIITSSTGIEILENSPIPFSTPPATIPAVSPRNTSIHPTFSSTDDPIPAKTSRASATLLPLKLPAQERSR